jgi:hypothetical protein
MVRPHEAAAYFLQLASQARPLEGDPELRKTALFWLGQSEDPRALGLFEEILR